MLQQDLIRRLAVPALAVLLTSGLAGCGSISTTQVKGYMISQSALDQVPVGSSQEQVLVVLGTPSTTSTVDGQTFYYISSTEHRAARFLKPELVDRRVLAVYFDKDRRVSRIANYGLQDGKVFDFISRKTPTTGVERSLLGQMLGLLHF